MAGSAHERPATEPDFRSEHLHERAAPHAALPDHGDDARDAARHVVERLGEARQRLRAPDEAIEVEAAGVAPVRDRRVVRARFGLRAARGTHELVEVHAMLGRGRPAEPDRLPPPQCADAASATMGARGGA